MAREKSAANVAFGTAVRAGRHERGQSLEALARLTGLDPIVIEAIERGEGNVTYLTVLKIADALGMSAAELVGRVGL
jgi:transcriptional regulator with XRE-family HTH domain